MSWLGVRGRACVSMAQGALAWMGAASPVGEAGPGDEGKGVGAHVVGDEWAAEGPWVGQDGLGACGLNLGLGALFTVEKQGLG